MPVRVQLEAPAFSNAAKPVPSWPTLKLLLPLPSRRNLSEPPPRMFPLSAAPGPSMVNVLLAPLSDTAMPLVPVMLLRLITVAFPPPMARPRNALTGAFKVTDVEPEPSLCATMPVPPLIAAFPVIVMFRWLQDWR